MQLCLGCFFFSVLGPSAFSYHLTLCHLSWLFLAFAFSRLIPHLFLGARWHPDHAEKGTGGLPKGDAQQDERCFLSIAVNSLPENNTFYCA